MSAVWLESNLHKVNWKGSKGEITPNEDKLLFELMDYASRQPHFFVGLRTSKEDSAIFRTKISDELIIQFERFLEMMKQHQAIWKTRWR